MLKIEDLITKSGFIEQLQNLTEPNQIIELFSENGVQVTKEEAKAILTAFSTKDELTEEDLSGIFGGRSIPRWFQELYYKRKKNRNGSFSGGGGGGGGHGF